MKGEKQNMNKFITKLAKLFLGISMAAGVGVAITAGRKDASPAQATDETYSLVPNNANTGSSATAYVTFEFTFTYSSVSWSIKQWNPKTLQIKTNQSSAASEFQIHNTSAFGGRIKSVVIKFDSASDFTNLDSSKLMFKGGTSAVTSTSGGTAGTWNSTNKTSTWTPGNSDSFTYFIFYQNGKAMGGTNKLATSDSIVVTYEVPEKYSVTYNKNTTDTVSNMPSQATGITSGSSYTLTGSPSRTGYDFGGWSTTSGTNNAGNKVTSITVNANTTVYAIWTAQQYNINYYDQGGSQFSGSHESGYPTKHTYGTETTLKSATKGGHSFDGWFTTSACTGSAVTSLGATSYTAAISLYAKWTATGTTYSISTTVINGTYSGDTTITDNGGVASVTISPTGDYKLPTSVSVSGASHTYNATNGVISLSGATGDVTISAVMVALTEYSITVNETNGSHTGASTIKESRTASLTFTPALGYGQPSSVTVSGATSSWTRGTGVLSLSNPTGNVTVTYTAAGNELDSISISTNSGSYTLGDNFVMPTVTAKYTVNADADVTSSASYSGYDPYTTGSQPVTISYSEGGITKTQSYTANVSAKSVGYSYNKISSVSDITEGDYIIAYSSYGFDGRDAGEGYTSVSVSNDSIACTAAMDKLAVHIVPVTGGYTMQLSSTNDNNPSKYVSFTSNSNSLSFADQATTVSIAAATSSTHLAYADGGYAIGDSSTYLSWNSNSGSANQRYRFYKVSTTTNSNNNTGMAYKAPELYKKISSGTADLIRITATYKGGDKYVGDSISTSDFTVKKQLNTGNELTDVASGYTISANTLTAESNSITISYTEGNITKTAVVVVPATPRSVTLVSVELVQGENVVKEYVDWSGAEWDFTDLSIRRTWSDASTESFDLADLVESEDASISPAKPAVGVTSFTVSYEYLSVSITNATVSDISVVADYVKSVSWGDKSLSHFKAFSGGQLTSTTVSGWTVKATYAGAGESNALSFGTGANQFTIRIGDSKAVTSLPYTWTTADDNEFIYVVVGGVAKGDSTNAKANICATINAIDHDETTTGEQTLSNFIDTSSATWTVTEEGISGGKDDGSSPLDVSNAGFRMESDNGYWNGSQLRSYKNSTFTISSTYTIKSITFTFSGSYSGGLETSYTSINATSKTFADLGSQARITGIAIVYEGSVKTTIHYANQDDHFDAQKKVVEFAKFMNTTMNGTNVCSGTFANLESAWDDVADKYDELFGPSTTLNETELAWAKNMLKYATAAWGSDAEAACVEKAMKTYEHCVSKYDLDAFMSPVRSVSSVKVSPLVNIISENTNTVAIIVIISMVSVTAIGGYFFLRKRKENI